IRSSSLSLACRFEDFSWLTFHMRVEALGMRRHAACGAITRAIHFVDHGYTVLLVMLQNPDINRLLTRVVKEPRGEGQTVGIVVLFHAREHLLLSGRNELDRHGLGAEHRVVMPQDRDLEMLSLFGRVRPHEPLAHALELLLELRG